MDLKEEPDFFPDVISQARKALLADEKETFAFAKLLGSNDFHHAYRMLSDSLKENFTEEELERYASENPARANPSHTQFQQEQMPYKTVAVAFAECLVRREFDKAFGMLTKAQQQEHTPASLEKNMKEMTDYFEDPEHLRVGIQFVLEEGAISDRCVYVPIEEHGNAEAVTLELVEEEGKMLVNNIDWGRP